MWGVGVQCYYLSNFRDEKGKAWHISSLLLHDK